LKILIKEAPPAGCAVQILNEHCDVYILIKGIVDLNAEIEKLKKK